MAYVARKPFLFNGKQFTPGKVIPKTMLDKYQEETFLRNGFIVEQVKKPVEVKPVEV